MAPRQSSSREHVAMEAIEGYWISFDPPERELVKRALVQDGYEPDGDGLKEWILDNCEEEPGQETDPLRERVRAYRRKQEDSPLLAQLTQMLRDDPEQVLAAMQNVSNIGGAAYRAILAGMKKGRR